MNWFASLPLEVRLAAIGLIGVLLATQLNRGIYRLAWFARAIGPWSAPDPRAPARSMWDRLPIVGWWLLRRESSIHGRGYWIRPLLIEIGVGVGLAALYWFEVEQRGLIRFERGVFVPPALAAVEALHWRFLSHLVLVSLMIVATFIDLDEQTIPDAITVPGALLGLTFAAAVPLSRTVVAVPAGMGYVAELLHIGSATGRPGVPGWPVWLDGPRGLAIGLACFVGWCVAIIPWTWTLRRGLGKAVQYWLASIPRRPSSLPIAVMGVLGSLAIAAVWKMGGPRWESLLSALVGLAVGGGIIWGVRIVGSAALQQEAMGFGDVTLMAMIGTFTGWQPTLVIFFLAPFTAILIAVSQYAFSGRHDIAFGPYLCVAALIWMVRSNAIWWDYGLQVFSLGWLVPAIGLSGLVLMGGMLQAWRLIRDWLFPWEEESLAAAASESRGVAAVDEGLPWVSKPRAGCPLRPTTPLQPPRAPIPGPRQVPLSPSRSQLLR